MLQTQREIARLGGDTVERPVALLEPPEAAERFPNPGGKRLSVSVTLMGRRSAAAFCAGNTGSLALC